MGKARHKRMVTDSALRKIELDKIGVDSSYQRGIIDYHVKKMGNNYNPKALGIPLVGEREDGSLWIVDGLQRISMLREKGNVKWVRAEVFASSGPEEEAEIFRLVNRERKKPTALQIFHAALTAGHEDAWNIKEIVERHGFNIPKGKTHGAGEDNPDRISKQVRAITAVEKMYRSQGAFETTKDAALDFVFSVLKQVWPSDPLKQRDVILYGLYGLFQALKGAVDMDRLIPRLNTVTPAKIIYTANQSIGSRAASSAETFIKLYNKRISPRN